MRNRQLTLGSLFDGIGGFPFCAVLSGVTPIWAAEVDPACVAVTKQRFPNMVHLGDVSKINGAEIPPVDIITFGSPCQDLSVAGARKGLKHSDNGDAETTRSGLFIDAIRIIYEMREATNGVYPAFIVWENVEGAFNSCGGRDFQTVLSEITKTDIPIPPSGKWAKAGVVRGRGICAAWRVLGAEYWGVPQRRKRVYLIGSFGTDSAAEILFKRDSVRGYLAPRGEAQQTPAAAVEAGVGISDFGVDAYNGSIEEQVPTLGTNCGKSTGRTLVTSENSLLYDARGNGDGNISPTITGDHNSRVTDYTKVVLQSMGFHGQNSVTAGSPELRKELSPTLTISKKADVVYAIGNGQANQTNLDYTLGALNCMHDQQAVIYTIDRAAFNQGENALYDPKISDDGIVPTLVARGPSAVAYQLYLTLKWIVRRLTPLECERLQGYPDGWTELPKISEMSDDEYDFYKALFILDNPKRYVKLYEADKLPLEINMWYGASVTTSEQAEETAKHFGKLPASPNQANTFLSVEPMLFDITKHNAWQLLCRGWYTNWMIAGAETGNRKSKVVPQEEWIDSIVADCVDYGIPVFMKDSLIPIVGEENMRREFPWAK